MTKMVSLTLSASTLDAELAAQVTHKALQMLQHYITSYKIEKASAQLRFIEERYNDIKKNLKKPRLHWLNSAIKIKM